MLQEIVVNKLSKHLEIKNRLIFNNKQRIFGKVVQRKEKQRPTASVHINNIKMLIGRLNPEYFAALISATKEELDNLEQETRREVHVIRHQLKGEFRSTSIRTGLICSFGGFSDANPTSC